MNKNIIPEKFFQRGSAYVERTIIFWSRRKGSLITSWNYTLDFKRKKRLYNLVNTLENRIANLSRLYNIKKLQMRKEKNESDEMIVNLECPSFECRYGPEAVGIGIRYKDYEPGKLKCDKCGLPLREQNQRSVDEMLFDAGIQF